MHFLSSGGMTAGSSGKVSLTDYQQEYNHILSNIKALSKEKEESTPEHIQQRLKREVLRAYDLLEMMGVPKYGRVTKLIADFQQDAELVIPRRTVFYWLGIREEDEMEDSATLHDSDSSLNTVLPENKEYDQMLADVQNAITLARAKLSKPFVSLCNQKEVSELVTIGKGLAKMANDCFDDRHLVATPLQPLFLQCAIDFTLQDAYSRYYLEVKDVIKKMTAESKIRGIRTLEHITSKRSHQLVYLKVKELHESLEPASTHEARIKGFSGQRCNKCGSLRCDRVPDGTEGRWYVCQRCDNMFEGVDVPPYTRGVVIDESHSTHQS